MLIIRRVKIELGKSKNFMSLKFNFVTIKSTIDNVDIIGIKNRFNSLGSPSKAGTHLGPCLCPCSMKYAFSSMSLPNWMSTKKSNKVKT